MENSTEFVTKKDLTKALDKVVEDLSEVIRDGFSLMATKKDVETLEQRMDERFHKMDVRFDKMDVRFDDVATKDDLAALEKKLLEDSDVIAGVHDTEHEGLATRVEALENVVFSKGH